MTQALFFKPSYERLRTQIREIAPSLDIILYDEQGRFIRKGKAVKKEAIAPEYFWIHSELFFSPCLEDYFQIILDSSSARWVHTINTGLDKLPYMELLNKGVLLTNNHSQAIAIAEYVIAQVLAHYHDIAGVRERQSQKIWQYQPFRELKDSRWLLLGFGHIGKQIARRLREFGVHIATVRRRQETEDLADAVFTVAELKSALAVADVVVLTCASNEQTCNIVDADFLSRMHSRSVLVNIARGDLIVEAALQESLERGIPEVAILDVFNQEPPARNSWVWQHPRVVLTPHSSNAGSGMRGRSDRLFLENLAHIIKDEPLVNVVAQSDIV